jgi:diacylglycerol kinase family enzyme
LFVTATLLTWATGYDRRRPAFSVQGPETGPDDGYFTICLNTDPYTYFGNRPMHLAPGTSLQTGLSLVTFQKLTLGTLLPVLGSAFGEGGKAGHSKHVSLLQGLDWATIKGYRPVPYQVDGDYVGESDHIELRWEAAALSLVMPTRTAASA